MRRNWCHRRNNPWLDGLNAQRDGGRLVLDRLGGNDLTLFVNLLDHFSILEPPPRHPFALAIDEVRLAYLLPLFVPLNDRAIAHSVSEGLLLAKLPIGMPRLDQPIEFSVDEVLFY